MKKIYNQRNEEVKRTVPADQLLVYEVKNEWQPLYRFLTVPAPEIPIHNANDCKSFQENVRKRTMQSTKKFNAANRHIYKGNPIFILIFRILSS